MTHAWIATIMLFFFRFLKSNKNQKGIFRLKRKRAQGGERTFFFVFFFFYLLHHRLECLWDIMHKRHRARLALWEEGGGGTTQTNCASLRTCTPTKRQTKNVMRGGHPFGNGAGLSKNIGPRASAPAGCGDFLPPAKKKAVTVASPTLASVWRSACRKKKVGPTFVLFFFHTSARQAGANKGQQ